MGQEVWSNLQCGHGIESVSMRVNKMAKVFTGMESIRKYFRAVVITDVKLMREVFNDYNFAGRPNSKSFNILAGGKFGKCLNDE